MISVLILTLNEENTLPGCLDSVKWCDDVVVFDSFSEDNTVQIARERNARVFQRRFDNYAGQRNAALEVEFKHRWVLMLDADERIPEDLKFEALTAVENAADEVTMFRMRRKDYFMGRWLKRSSGYPTWFGRLVRVGRVRVEREINEEYYTDGLVIGLQAHIDHFPFLKGINYWFERHNKYSTLEARVLAAESRIPLPYAQIFSSEPIVRRKVLKQILYRVPMRPIVVFFYLIFFRGGLFDGKAGITYAILRSMYEFMIDVKIAEFRVGSK